MSEDGTFVVVAMFGAIFIVPDIIFSSVGIATTHDNMLLWGWWAINIIVWVSFHVIYGIVMYKLSWQLNWWIRWSNLLFLIWVLCWSIVGAIYGDERMGLCAGFQIMYAGLSFIFVIMAMAMICCRCKDD